MPFDNTMLSAPATAAAQGLRSIAFGKLTDTAAPLLSYVQAALPGAERAVGQGALPGAVGASALGGIGGALQAGAGAVGQMEGGAASALGQGAGDMAGALRSGAAQALGAMAGMAGPGGLAQFAVGALPSLAQFSAIPIAPALSRLTGMANQALPGGASQAASMLHHSYRHRVEMPGRPRPRCPRQGALQPGWSNQG